MSKTVSFFKKRNSKSTKTDNSSNESQLKSQDPQLNALDPSSSLNPSNTKPTQPSNTSSSVKSILSNEDIQSIESNSNNIQQLNPIFNRLFQNDPVKLSFFLNEIDSQSQIKSIFINFVKNQLNSPIESDSFINSLVSFLSIVSLVNSVSQVFFELEINEQQINNFTNLFCHLILNKNDFSSYLIKHISDFQLFKLINYQIFFESISKSEQVSNSDKNYLSLLLLFIFNYSTKDNISHFPFGFLNNLFISNLDFISKFQTNIQNLFDKNKLFDDLPKSEEELYFTIFSKLLIY
jgi:hypothetical protein